MTDTTTKPATTEQIHDSRDTLQKLDAVEQTLNDCAFTCDSDAVGYIPAIRDALEGKGARIAELEEALRKAILIIEVDAYDADYGEGKSPELRDNIKQLKQALKGK